MLIVKELDNVNCKRSFAVTGAEAIQKSLVVWVVWISCLYFRANAFPWMRRLRSQSVNKSTCVAQELAEHKLYEGFDIQLVFFVA